MKHTAICALLLLTASLFAGCSGGDSDSDGDGIKDEFDNCPNISNPLQADYDIALGLDGGDECDDDDDNDGWTDENDAFPYLGSEWIDTDNDDIGNND